MRERKEEEREGGELGVEKGLKREWRREVSREGGKEEEGKLSAAVGKLGCAGRLCTSPATLSRHLKLPDSVFSSVKWD